jgi:predicted dienelactone hydrolase
LIAVPPVVFPVPVLPAPGGSYALGTVTYDWVDPARAEIYGPGAAGKREIMAQVWYPAAPAPGAQPAPWMNRLDVVGPAIANYLHLPSFILDHASLIRTHSYPAAPLSAHAARYPVVIYSHGWNGFRTINTNQLEALASRGYVVVSIDHTYGALVTVFGDGRVVLNNPRALPQGAPAADYQKASETLEAIYAADIRFVLDQLVRLDAGELDARFAGRLDLDRIGVFGHSTGGGAMVLACSQDARCQAGLGMDAWVEPVPGAVIEQGLSRPFLFMRSAAWTGTKNDARLDRLYGKLAPGSARLSIRGTKHYDFVMAPLLSPLAPLLGLKGPLEGHRAMQIVTDYLVAFFDQTLKGQPSPLLAGPSPSYPEVTFERRGQ